MKRKSTHPWSSLVCGCAIVSSIASCTSSDPSSVAATAPGAEGGAGSAGAENGGSGAAGSTGGTTGSAGATTTAGGGAGAGGTPSTGGAGQHACPQGLEGPALVEVKTPTGAYCIDADTVTVGQYQKFLDDKKGDMSGQPDQCSINTTYAPQEKKGGDNPWPSAFCSLFAYINPATQPEVPMPCADWCDAHAYCAWAGKRLCGKLGGGPIDVFPIGGPEMIDDPPTTEWAFACSQGGKTQYSYGDTYDAAACKVAYEVTPPNYLAALAATNATCHGTQPPFDKIAGVGSLFEWLDGFGSDPMLSPIRASGNGSDPVGDRCSSVFEDVILSQNYVGVRCCTD